MKNPPSPELAQAQKAALRERFLAARRALSPTDYAAASAAICDGIAALPEVRAAATVHTYWPVVDRREVDVRPLVRRLAAEGKRVVLPVVAAYEGAPALRHVLFGGESRMRTSRWGIAEPHGTDEVDPAEVEAVIVPAFGAGRNGHRIGHGRGFYDAFLGGPAQRAFAVGAVYAACLVPAVPAEPHDAALGAIVTERETVRVGAAPVVPPAAGPA